jgi:MFS family permease
MVVGLPGVALAVLVRFTLREPERGASEGIKPSQADAPPVMDVFRYLWAKRSFRYLALGGALHAFVGYGVGFWIPAFFMRTHGMSTALLGQWLFFLGFAGMAGTILGGWMADRLAVRDFRWYVWLPGLATLVSVPFAAAAYLSPSYTAAFLILIVPTLLGSYYLGPTFALTQGLVGLRMRAMASSILLFILNLIGMGLGPSVTGIISDLLAATPVGAESLRWALLIVLSFNVASTGFYILAGRYLREDMARRPDDAVASPAQTSTGPAV